MEAILQTKFRTEKKVISPKLFDGRFLQFISNLLALFQLKNASSNNFDLNFHFYAKCFIGLALGHRKTQGT